MNWIYGRQVTVHWDLQYLLCSRQYGEWVIWKASCDVIHILAGPFVTVPPIHRCWPGGSMRACHAAGPGSIPGREKFPGWGFFGVIPLPARQMSGSFRPQGPPILFGHHYHHLSSFITGANDLRCWRALKPQIYIQKYTYIRYRRHSTTQVSFFQY